MTPRSVTSHTKSRVPFILVCGDPEKYRLHAAGTLQNVAATVLDLLGIKRPKEMEESLLQ